MPKVSVIIPVYQAEKYLKSCIDSILRQSFSDFELILIDDGSKDQSGAICDDYAQMDSRVKVIHQTNAGVSAARNAGLEICCGEYITFVDADDTIDSGFLELAVNALANSAADIFLSGLCMETWENGEIDSSVRYGVGENQNWTVRELLENLEVSYPQICICGPCCKLYKNEIIQKNTVRFTEALKYGEDTYFNLDYFSHCEHIVFSREIFYHYRRENAESLFSCFHKDTYEVHRMVYGKMRLLMQILGCSNASMHRFEALYFAMLMGGVHEYYRFYSQTTTRERLNQIAKVGKDACISQVKMGYIRNRKTRILFSLLRIRWYLVVALIFEIKYCITGC